MPTRTSTTKSKTTAATTKKATTTKRTTASTAKPKTSTTRKTTTKKAPASVTAAAKAATAKSTPAKPAPIKSAPVKPATVTKLEPVVAGPALRKKELLDTVALKTGMKRAEVKKVVEATLATMGLALQDSRDLNVQPFGTVKINRERKLPDGKVVVARIRQARDLAADDVPPEPVTEAKTAAE